MAEVFTDSELCLIREAMGGKPESAIYHNRMTRDELVTLVLKLDTIRLQVVRGWQLFSGNIDQLSPIPGSFADIIGALGESAGFTDSDFDETI